MEAGLEAKNPPNPLVLSPLACHSPRELIRAEQGRANNHGKNNPPISAITRIRLSAFLQATYSVTYHPWFWGYSGTLFHAATSSYRSVLNFCGAMLDCKPRSRVPPLVPVPFRDSSLVGIHVSNPSGLPSHSCGREVGRPHGVVLLLCSAIFSGLSTNESTKRLAEAHTHTHTYDTRSRK